MACGFCGAEGDVYMFAAELEGLAITEACVDCIRSQPLEAITPWWSEQRAAEHLRSVFPEWSPERVEQRRAEMCADLRRTPRVPLFWRRDDWPLCCGDFAEYIGAPDIEPMTDGLSVFRCATCSRVYEVIQ